MLVFEGGGCLFFTGLYIHINKPYYFEYLNSGCHSFVFRQFTYGIQDYLPPRLHVETFGQIQQNPG